jgi:hypothetical protein
MDNLSPRACLQCGKSLHGRIDQRFCDSYCRNTFNNRNKPVDEHFIALTNSRLRKNRRILKTLCPQGKATLRREVLSAMGYDFGLYTGQFRSASMLYYLVYDFAFAPIWENDVPKALIVHRQNYMDKGAFDPWQTN